MAPYKVTMLVATVIMFSLSVALSLSISSEAMGSEDGWQTDISDKGYIRVHVNGNATWGDRLMIFLNMSNCSKAEINMYFSSYNDELLDFDGSSILMDFGGAELDSKIVSVHDFLPLLSHRIATIQLGFILKESLYEWESRADEVSVKISENNPQALQDAFDVKFNDYTLTGLTEALAKIEEHCVK